MSNRRVFPFLSFSLYNIPPPPHQTPGTYSGAAVPRIEERIHTAISNATPSERAWSKQCVGVEEETKIMFRTPLLASASNVCDIRVSLKLSNIQRRQVPFRFICFSVLGGCLYIAAMALTLVLRRAWTEVIY